VLGPRATPEKNRFLPSGVEDNPFRLIERLANVRAFSFIKRREVVCANCVCRVGFHVCVHQPDFGFLERDA
jgi:hypothetical protein